MTPKSLLRSKAATSSLEDLSRGTFQRVICDQLHDRPGSEVRQILLCSGKIYYGLADRREQLQRNDVAILRTEQLYPVPDRELELLLAQYPDGTPVSWVQEEPENMGAWRTLWCHWGNQMYGRHPLTGVCRPASASPATGSKKSHDNEQAEVIARAFGEVR